MSQLKRNNSMRKAKKRLQNLHIMDLRDKNVSTPLLVIEVCNPIMTWAEQKLLSIATLLEEGGIRSISIPIGYGHAALHGLARSANKRGVRQSNYLCNLFHGTLMLF
ncbi:hypothetical protein CEXT_183221 [Caerostris extrusa]|uniref:Uncharacterized protein n=1 Tax=Caerostris extrusa TaxID=172846 RepID=A0AAV4Y9J5_CAEEX|nr:hypothetical protein CEXT_183221 [Caerostris extrusa]